jgi:hypothetical protein
MSAAPTLAAVLACAVLATGCSWPIASADPPARAVRLDMGLSGDAVPLEREIRYYRDEQGAVWDDRGRKQAPGTSD